MKFVGRRKTNYEGRWATSRDCASRLLPISLKYAGSRNLAKHGRDGWDAGLLRHESACPDAAHYLEAGDTIDEFLEGFPTVQREQVIAFLEQAKDRLVESVS